MEKCKLLVSIPSAVVDLLTNNFSSTKNIRHELSRRRKQVWNAIRECLREHSRRDGGVFHHKRPVVKAGFFAFTIFSLKTFPYL